MIPAIITLLICALIIGYCVSIYNGLVALRREAMNGFSQIDVQLKRRHDLIPNLVETVKGYMKFEQETLEKVISARNLALKASSVAEKANAETQITTALNGLFAVAEAYPDLKSSSNMLQLQEELSSTENKIAFARQYYNDIVTRYNTRIETFPASIFAGAGGFKERELFEIEDPAQREPVKVSF